MVFADIFRQKMRKEGREEGPTAGIEEANTAWRAWNHRREEAMGEGMPFDEPTPDLARGTDPPDPEPSAKPQR